MTNTANRDVAWYRERIAWLAEFMLPERYDVLRRTVAMRTRYMTILAENTFHPQNAAALIRHCEAFGKRKIHAASAHGPVLGLSEGVYPHGEDGPA